MNILIVGVGGQGSLLASRILGALFLQKGLAVKVSEVHGMSQRGGSVVTYVRAGEEVISPLIPMGEADLMIAFEQLEALRWAETLRPNGTLVVSTQTIRPLPVITGAAQYPTGIVDTLASRGITLVPLDALTLARQAGNDKAVNTVCLGAASHSLEFTEDEWMRALESTVSARLLDVNKTAFQLGRNCKAT